MRILITTAHLGIIGGVETYLQAVVRELTAQGHAIGVLCGEAAPEGREAVATAASNCHIWNLSAGDSLKLYESVKAWSPDVVYSHGSFCSEIEDKLASRFPVVFYAHNYYGTCISGTKCHSKTSWNICERVLGAGCLPLYLPRGCGGQNPITMWKLFRQQMANRRRLQMYSVIAVASRHMLDEYVRQGVPRQKLKLLPLFAPNASPSTEPPPPKRPNGRIVFVGRITPLKGLQHLLESLPIASQELGRPLHLKVVGDGPERSRLEALAKRLGLDTEFLGWLSGAETTHHMAQSDLLAIPSLWPEPFGLVGIEAGSFGVPSVGYLRGGISDWLLPGVSGEASASSPPQPIDLAASLKRALIDETHWNQLRKGAWAVARQFTIEKHMSELTRLLEVTIK
ncbi:MAG: glycosyltransferase family 4 protein [Pirellulales bacterium]